MEHSEGLSDNQKLLKDAKTRDSLKVCQVISRPTPVRAKQTSLQNRSNKACGSPKKDKQDQTKRGSGNTAADRKKAVPTGTKSVAGNKDVVGNTALRNFEAKQKRRVDDRRFFPVTSGRRKLQADILIGKKPAKHCSSCPQDHLISSPKCAGASESPEAQTSLLGPDSVSAQDPGCALASGLDQESVSQNAAARPKAKPEVPDQEHLKSVLRLLRSDLSPADKLRAIKCNKDHWEQARGTASGDSTKAAWNRKPAKSASCESKSVTASAYDGPESETDRDSTMSGNDDAVRGEQSAPQGLHDQFKQETEVAAMSAKDDAALIGSPKDRFCDSGGGFELQVGHENLEIKTGHELDMDLTADAEVSTQCLRKDPVLEDQDACAEVCESSSVKKEKSFHPIDCARPLQIDMHRDCDPLICDDAMDLAALQSPGASDAVACAVETTNENAALDPGSGGNTPKPENSLERLSPNIAHRRTKHTLSPMSLSVDIKDGSLSSNQSTRASPKSPITVQEWVDSIDVINSRTEDGVENVAKDNCLSHNHEGEDNLGLGAEAYNLNKKNDPLNAQPRSPTRKGALGKARAVNNSLQSETSNLSAGSLSSVEALLETMQHDPEDILLSLGFGKTVAHPLNRIPQRFLHQSQVPGNNLNEFLEKQDEMLELYDMGFCGYRGLSGFRMDGHKPSGIVCKILEKMRDRNRELRRSLPAPSLTVSSPSLSFYHAVFSLMAVNAFRSAIRSTSSKNSILDPKNREFLDSQEEDSVKPRGKRRPRLVLGKESFALDTDEEIMDDESSERLSPRPVSPVERSWERNPDLRNGKTLSSVGSDDVFSPAEKKPTLWGVVRDLRLASVPSSLMPSEANSGNDTDNVQNCQSRCEEKVVTNPELTSKRTNRLTRQLSIDEVEPEAEVTGRCHPKLGTLKTETAPNKDSFELEELPASGDLPDDENLGQLQANNRDAPRTGSAMSDSSGFLEGETLDTSNIDISDDLLPDFVAQKQAHRSSSLLLESFASSSQLLDSQQSSLDALPPVAEDEFCAGVSSSTKTSVLRNMSESGFESFNTQEKEEYLMETGQTTGGLSPVGYLSESDTVVVDFASSSSGDAISSQNDRSPISGSCDLPIIPSQETIDAKPSISATSGNWCEVSLPDRTLDKERLNLFMSTSEVDLNLLDSYRAVPKAGQRNRGSSLGDICPLDSGAFSKKLPRHPSDEIDSVFHETPASTGVSERIGEFHEGCLLTIQRMHQLMQLYQKKLKQMERTCWSTYHQLFPGVSKSDSEELEKLCDLRRLVLAEAGKTQMLLSQRSAAMKTPRRPCHTSCDFRLVTVAEELGELLREQDAMYDQLQEFSCDSVPHMGRSGTGLRAQSAELPHLLNNVKQEVITEVKGIIHDDHAKFQSELVETKQGIEDVKSILTSLLSVIKSGKS